jgi:phenylacetate-CoA ligase
MFSEAIRRCGFWLIDALCGEHVRKNIMDLEQKLIGQENISDNLQNILKHAVNTTMFYGNFKDYSDIRDFPVIKKSLVKEKYDQFISSEYKNKPLHKAKTSGSTGERFVLLQDRQKRKRVISELIYFHEQCGFKLGNRYVYVIVWHRENKKTKLAQIAENFIPFDCSSLSNESQDRLYQLLRKDHSIKCLIGFANSLAAIASYLDKQNCTPDMFNIKIVVSCAERLEPGDKALLKKVFGCPVVSRYSNVENGVLAQQPTDDDYFILNTAHYFFETLRLDSDEQAPCGEPARLVLTDLYNYAMPLIRYDTEDIVIMETLHEKGYKKKILTEISGRKTDIIYDTRGNKISPHFVTFEFRRYDRLPQFQFIQESLKNFTIKLEGARGLYEDNDIRKTMCKLVGQDAIIKIEHVDKIPNLSSGKSRRVICKSHTNPN